MAITLNLTERQAEGLNELIVLARQRRGDYVLKAEAGECSVEDRAAADTRWDRAQSTIRAVSDQKCHGPLGALEALEEWADVARGMYDCEAWGSFTCREAEATAELARVIGRDEVADMIIEAHSDGDDDPEDDHYKGAEDGER